MCTAYGGQLFNSSKYPSYFTLIPTSHPMMECQNTATAKIKVYDVNGVNADEFWLLNIYMYVVFGI